MLLGLAERSEMFCVCGTLPKMPTLVVATRVLLLAGDVLRLRRLSLVSERAQLCTTVRSFSQSNRENGSLTLASLGSKSDFKTTNKRRPNNLVHSETSIELQRTEEKVVKSNGGKEVGVKKIT